MVMALPRRRSQLELRGVALRPANRGLLDLLRQMGATIRIAGRDDETADIAVEYTAHLRATRVAGERAARLLPQLPLVAVLATQCTGEFVLRDLQALRQGPTDRVAVLYSLLKSLGAHVAEYEQGLVVRGGTPLDGCRLDCGGDPELAMACGAAGALAHGETTITGVECLEAVYPDFFATVEVLSR
jgi:3-phosphoshikimate 1-carboxyvinyltransferase